jgi:hypothetical protein
MAVYPVFEMFFRPTTYPVSEFKTKSAKTLGEEKE